MRRISFFILLSGLFIFISSILLLIWWPVKATLVEISNSWITVIMIYIILIFFLYERPLYHLYDDFIIKGKLKRNISNQVNQEILFNMISDEDFNEFISCHDAEWENLISQQERQEVCPVNFIDKVSTYIFELNKKRITLSFLLADNYLVIKAKYILFWFYKFTDVSIDIFHQVWEEKVKDFKERDAILRALMNLEFLKKDNNNFMITQLGKNYVNYLKKLDDRIINNQDISANKKEISEDETVTNKLGI